MLEQNNFCLVAFWVRPWECTAAFRRPLRPSFMLLSKLVYNLCVCACGLSRFLCRGIIKTRWYIWVQQCGTLEIALYFQTASCVSSMNFLHWTISNATKDHCHVAIIDKYLIASFFQLAKQQQQMQSLGQLVNLLLKVVELKVIVLGTRVLLI